MRRDALRFIHCERCGQTARIPADEVDRDAAAEFRQTHGSCRLETFEPTGRGVSSRPWHEPMATRRLEVRGDDGLAMAIGARRLLQEPVVWRIERQEAEEKTEIELDRPLFRATVDRALFPSHVPQRSLEEWGTQIEHFARSAQPCDIVLLEDDPGSGDATFACFTLTARARLESGLQGFGFDESTEARLAALFDEELFPPLRVRRQLVAEERPSSLGALSESALTR